MDISIIIPTLNEEKNISKVINDARYFLNNKYSYELIIADGNSNDNTIKIAKKLNAKIICNCTGKGTAIRRGMKNAEGEIIIIMDADCSHQAEELKLLIQTIKNGYDVCMGSRFLKGGGTSDMPLYRKIGNRFFIFLVNTLWKTKYTDLCYGYRSFRKGVIKNMHLESTGFSIETEISIKAAKMNLKTLEIPSFEKKRMNGVGKLRTIQDGSAVLLLIIKELFRQT